MLEPDTTPTTILMTVIDFFCHLLLTRKMNELEAKGCRFLFLFCLCEYRKEFVVQQTSLRHALFGLSNIFCYEYRYG